MSTILLYDNIKSQDEEQPLIHRNTEYDAQDLDVSEWRIPSQVHGECGSAFTLYYRRLLTCLWFHLYQLTMNHIAQFLSFGGGLRFSNPSWVTLRRGVLYQ